jgi:hypothetical protein
MRVSAFRNESQITIYTYKNLISQNFEIKMSHKCHTEDRREGKSNFHLLCCD